MNQIVINLSQPKKNKVYQPITLFFAKTDNIMLTVAKTSKQHERVEHICYSLNQ